MRQRVSDFLVLETLKITYCFYDDLINIMAREEKYQIQITVLHLSRCVGHCKTITFCVGQFFTILTYFPLFLHLEVK